MRQATIPLPLLRAPPFPGARPRGGPLAAARRPVATPETVARLAEAVARARVGGDFWSGRDPWARLESGAPVVAAHDEEIALLAAAAGVRVTDAAGGLPLPGDVLRARLAEAVLAFDYHDPFTGAPIAPERWIAQLAEWRALLARNRRIAAVHGIAWWKRASIARFLWRGAPASGGAAAYWPSRARVPAGGWRIEDGFIRSAGLGTLLHPPQSIVVDARGIHYDPARPSDLEHLLETTAFDAALRERAAALARGIVAAGVTKYAADAAALPPLPARRCVLVAGQVEDDESVRLGGAGVADNRDLLRRARAAEPDAFLIYKPHPDVAAGLRRGHVPPREALRHADLVLPRAPIAALLARVDAVHVLTSLTGFEALLRGREVVVHGQPFYAGWGLTRDLAAPIARRTRRLALEELVAGALILYPRYLDPVTRLPCPPEVLVARMAERPRPRTGALQHVRAVQGLLHRAARQFA